MKTNTPQRLLICLGIALAYSACASDLRADSTYWTGASDSNWFNDANWTNHVPTASTDAYINGGPTASIRTPGATAHTLTIGENPGDSGALEVNGVTGGSLTIPIPCGVNTSDPAVIFLGIYVGYGGHGDLSIVKGGTVSSGYGYIALLPGDATHKPSSGTVTITDTSAWTLSGCRRPAFRWRKQYDRQSRRRGVPERLRRRQGDD